MPHDEVEQTDQITAKLPMVRIAMNQASEAEDVVAVEYAFTITLNGEEFATIVCTPTHLEELVIGFLASEGIIRTPQEIESLTLDEDRGVARVQLYQAPDDLTKQMGSKRFIGSCCGKSRQFYLLNDARTAKTARTNLQITPQQCLSLMKQMQEGSHSFQQTGGVHNAALCSPQSIVVQRTDIGRHNALDKVYGYCLQHRIQTKDAILVFSGRISSEVLLKVAKLGAGIVLSKSAPTTLALELAHDLRITTVGFIRGETMNVYTHPERIIGTHKTTAP
jgi:FdhD protein